MLIFAAMLLAQAEPLPAAQPTVEEAPATVAANAAPPPEKVCRTRFKTGQGLIGSMKQVKVCKTKAEWAAVADRTS